MPEPKGQSKSNGQVDERLEISLLVVGKRIGLSFLEMNELRSVDLLDMAKVFSGREDDKPKEATQADIDSFFGR